MYDRACQSCGAQKIDCWEPVATNDPVCTCGSSLKRVWLAHASAVIGDEIDVTIKHGMCNPDGSPKRWRSREELRKATAKAGLVNRVEHVGGQGSDKSEHTTRWV